MTTPGWLSRFHRDRCARKRAFRTAAKADILAECASRKTGELIISYQCFDCGKWHIGHADQTQILARRPPSSCCVVCGKPIEKARISHAHQSGNRTRTCSPDCHRIDKKARRLKTKEARAPDPVDAEDETPRSPGGEGLNP